MNDPRNSANYESWLARLEQRLAKPGDDEAMLSEVGAAIRLLLTSNEGSERRIRQILKRQFDQGTLRKETYELVENLVSRITGETAESVDPEPTEVITDEPYERTAVIDQPGQVPGKPEVSNRLQIGTMLRDRYLLKESVAEGSMGIVYKALDRRLAEAGEDNCFVAIKVLSPRLSRNAGALRALQQEASKGRSLTHPNIVRFIDLDRESELFFIVMEWLPGKSLAAILDEKPGDAIDPTTAFDIVRQLASALDYAHQRGVVHADVKPGNVMVMPDGQVKLIDFGVARVRQKENEGRSRFDPDVIRGATPAYSSMQVLTGEEPVPADDVFSLACLLYRLIAGRRIFGPRNAADAAEQGLEPQQPQGVPDKQWHALRKALSYSRVMRFRSPMDFVAALELPETKPAAPLPVLEEAIDQPADAVAMVADIDVEPPAESVLHVDQDSIMYHPDEKPRRSPWRIAAIVAIIAASAAVVMQPGLIDTFTDLAPGSGSEGPGTADVNGAGADAEIEELAPMPEIDVAETSDEIAEEFVVDSAGGSVEVIRTETADDAQPGISGEEAAAAVEGKEVEVPLIDFALLPAPSLLIALPAAPGEMPLPETLSIREDGADETIDLIRGGDLSQAMSVQFVEERVGVSQLASEQGQYAFENDGILVFEPGQPRARISLGMRSDTAREPDRSVVVSIRDSADTSIALGAINLTLEDDDQRRFEAGLQPDTVAFAVNQLTVRESDPAVQVDVIRLRPTNTAVEVGYRLIDVTATEGMDYFAPGLPLIYFAPEQRSARILIPLGQDARPEPNEAFRLELVDQSIPDGSDIFSQIAVIIRDDDS
jgi:serine/threonine protein kinase